jgi:hypothetical protein
MIREVVTLILACFCVSSACAADVTIGAVSIKLSSPPGYCELDASNVADARMIRAAEGLLEGAGNRLLSLSADCGQLADWRAGRRELLDNTAQQQTRIGWDNVQLPMTPEALIKFQCDDMRARGDRTVTDVTPDAQRRLEDVLKTVRINEMQFLGVLDEEPMICYAGLLQRFLTEAGADKAQVVVFATTIVRQKLLYYYLFAPYVNGETARSMLEQQKVNVRRLRSENPD